MIKREAPADAIQGFLKAVHDSLIEPLRRNQSKISFQRELRESKRFQDAEAKLKDYADLHSKIKDNFFLRDNILDILRKFQATRAATRMTQFLEKSKEMSLQESNELKEALTPYLSLLKPVEDIRRLQTAMMNQGKIKKMTLPYDEITATLNETTALVSKMPGILMNGICDLSENLDQVA